MLIVAPPVSDSPSAPESWMEISWAFAISAMYPPSMPTIGPPATLCVRLALELRTIPLTLTWPCEVRSEPPSSSPWSKPWTAGPQNVPTPPLQMPYAVPGR